MTFAHFDIWVRIAKITLREIDLLFGCQQLKFLYLWNDKSWRKNVWETFVDFGICHRMMKLTKLHFETLTYFSTVTILNLFISETVRANTKKCVGDICKFWHFLSNGVISKITFHDLDLLFKGIFFINLFSLKPWELAQKCTGQLL